MPNRTLISGHLTALALTEQGRKAVTITRAGSFSDPRYGQFDITPALLGEMVFNFQSRTYGQDIHIDVSHKPDEGSAGKVARLWIEGDRLMAEVDWTPYGRKAISERGYQYLSAEYTENFIDNERQQPHGAVLLGAGLTIRPVIKRLDPIELAEPTGLHHLLADQLLQEARKTMSTHLHTLRDRLADLKLSDKIIGQLGDGFTAAAKHLGEDDPAMDALVEQFVGTGKTLAEAFGERDATINLSVQAPRPTAKGLTAADVERILSERETARDAAAKKLAADQSALRGQFRAALDAHEGVKHLGEELRTLLLSAEGLITPNMTVEQVQALAAQQTALADQVAVSRQLSALGWQGSTRITLGTDHSPLKLQEDIHQGLRQSYSFGSSRTGLRLTEEAKLHPFAKRVLALFDRQNAADLAAETRLLADGGPTKVANMDVPKGFQRTVIREALSDLAILDVVQTLTDPNAQGTTQIPYELRKAGTIVNSGIVYESAEIPRASIEQKMDLAYINAMKLSMKISNEVMHFSSASLIDWDAYGRNVASNARLIRELVCQRLANEMQRSADAYAATAITGENIAAQMDGSKSLIKTAQWPIVRPMQYRDLAGGTIGSALNPIALSINGTAITAWDGTGSQANGNYYVVENWNLGLIRVVNQAGVAQTPTHTSGATTIGYSHATNIVKFDLKLPASTKLEDHLNAALRAVGARKAMLSASRFIQADFMLMSPILNDMLTNATQFAAEAARAGSALTGSGDLATIKALPAYGTNAPGIDLGVERLIMGERGTLSYVVAKPYMIGQPFEAVGASGLPTGEKISYGEEYNALHVPLPIRNRLTSIIYSDSDARTAAA
jgi:hypothetical protein